MDTIVNMSTKGEGDDDDRTQKQDKPEAEANSYPCFAFQYGRCNKPQCRFSHKCLNAALLHTDATNVSQPSRAGSDHSKDRQKGVKPAPLRGPAAHLILGTGETELEQRADYKVQILVRI